MRGRPNVSAPSGSRRALRIAAAAISLILRPGAAAAGPAGDPPVCSDCHDVAAALQDSVHGQAGLECGSCHSDVAESAGGPHTAPEPVDCRSCHDAPTAAAHPPTCANCHGGHDIERITGSARSTTADRIAASCGTCHEEIVADYMEGIHGRDLARGNPDVPTCLTCHGGHAIMLNEDPNSPVSPKSAARTCARCHDDEEISRKYGLPPGRLASFIGSFHGLATEYGEKGVANCASCHGVHKILPSSDPASTIHPANLPATCGRCHPQAGRNFAAGKVHLEDRWEDNPFTWVARRFYQGTIAAMMAVFAVFMAVDFGYRRRRRGEAARGKGGMHA